MVGRHVAPPLDRRGQRELFLAPNSNGRDYLRSSAAGEKRRLTIDSVRSLTTGQTEIVFARPSTRCREIGRRCTGAFAVIAMSRELADVGDERDRAGGLRLRHHRLRPERCSSTPRASGTRCENFFAETDQDPKLRAAVAARQSETHGRPLLGRRLSRARPSAEEAAVDAGDVPRKERPARPSIPRRC